jgi:methylthioribose-1-phosphate isomerase
MIHDNVRAIRWQDNHLQLLDQRRLPHEVAWLDLYDAADTAAAIRDMVVRGAPAIGVTAAYGIVMAARRQYQAVGDDWKSGLEHDLDTLRSARPTAVNLFWAIDRMAKLIEGLAGDPTNTLLQEARSIHDEDIEANHQMGKLGAALIEPGKGVLTHCNTGSLATGGYGTALGVIRTAWSQQRINEVYADETRPWLQGARLTAWELGQDDVPVNVVVEGAAASLMASGKIGWVIVGSDRIAANGDVANKIGTCNLAIIARHYGVRFMVVAPVSTCDPDTPDGASIPIETRNPDEVLTLGDQRIAAMNAAAWNPVFDVTPAELIDAIVTEQAVILNPNAERMSVLWD